MATTTTKFGANRPEGAAAFDKHSDVSATNAAVTVSTPNTGRPRRLVSVTAHYDGAATHAGITVTLNSGLGAAYDAILDSSAANADDYLFTPSGEFIIDGTDTIDVLAPAGGADREAGVIIITEEL